MFPTWLERLASWANARICYGSRDHVVHYPAGSCATCEIWLEHDACFNGTATYELTELGQLMREAGQP